MALTGLLSGLLAAAFAVQEVSDEKIDELIRDLGAEEYKTREEAQERLLEIGKPAMPALKEALEDEDAERAHRAREILKRIRERSGTREGMDRMNVRMRVSARDLTRGVKLEMYPDGRVELTVPVASGESGKKVYRTYKAESLEGFKKKHPELAKEYRIERFIPRIDMEGMPDPDRTGEDWETWRDWFERDWFWDRNQGLRDWLNEWSRPFGSPLDEWLEDQEDLFKRFRDLPAPPKSEEAGRRFGIRIEAVDEALAAHLNLKAGRGVLVREVLEGSLAEQAGVRRHDILLELDDDPVRNVDSFRRRIQERLGGAFELEILRAGKRETLKVASED